MRTTRDRLRHAIGFELIGLLIAAPLASWVTGVGLNHMGPLALFGFDPIDPDTFSRLGL